MPPAQSTPEQSFRSSLAQFSWSSSSTQNPNSTTNHNSSTSTSAGTNPFSRFYNSVTAAGSGYIPLRSGERSNEEEAYFALSRWDRLLGFGACLIGAAVCFFIAFIMLPVVMFRPSKFAMALSLGSLLVMVGFSILIGPITHLKHLFSRERLPFTAVYFGSLGLTLYFALGARSYIGSLIGAVIQLIALVSYILAYFPGGIQTLRFGGQIALRGAGSLLPV